MTHTQKHKKKETKEEEEEEEEGGTKKKEKIKISSLCFLDFLSTTRGGNPS